MKKWLLLLALSSKLAALQNEPWLGNWLEFEATLSESHTSSSRLETKKGVRRKLLHRDATAVQLEFTQKENLSWELELDLAKTQKKGYGFDALKADIRYQFLNDLRGDPVTFTLQAIGSLSTPSRVRDLSSQQHGVCDIEARLVAGREFIIDEENFYKAWGYLSSGIASSGSPWVGAQAHFGKVFCKNHLLDLFFSVEKGLSSEKLRSPHHFHSWSRIGYQYEELGLSYKLKRLGTGTFYVEGRKRLHARFCPKNSWSLTLGFTLPFSPW